MSVALKAAGWAWRFKETKNDSPVPRTPGSHDSPVLRTILHFQRVKYCNSLVHRTPGSLNSPVHRTPGVVGSCFKIQITISPRPSWSKKWKNFCRLTKFIMILICKPSIWNFKFIASKLWPKQSKMRKIASKLRPKMIQNAELGASLFQIAKSLIAN